MQCKQKSICKLIASLTYSKLIITNWLLTNGQWSNRHKFFLLKFFCVNCSTSILSLFGLFWPFAVPFRKILSEWIDRWIDVEIKRINTFWVMFGKARENNSSNMLISIIPKRIIIFLFVILFNFSTSFKILINLHKLCFISIWTVIVKGPIQSKNFI